MIINIKTLSIFFFAAIFVTGCKKEEYSFGDLTAPSNLTLSVVVAGANATNPNGDGSGFVAITAVANNALSYNIDFGDGVTKPVSTGTINYKYATPGTSEFMVTVNAIGKGGTTSTISKKIKIFVAFEIPAAIVSSLTGGSSKVWVVDKDAPGHVGVGPADQFSPIWYAAGPGSRDACLYDDELTFSKDASNNISMSIDNKGQSFIIGAAAAFYAQSAGEICAPVSTGGTKKLAFMDASSGSTSAISTMLQFVVPANGIMAFGTGGTAYEILSLTDTNMEVRNIGVDNNAWYQKFKVKP